MPSSGVTGVTGSSAAAGIGGAARSGVVADAAGARGAGGVLVGFIPRRHRPAQRAGCTNEPPRQALSDKQRVSEAPPLRRVARAGIEPATLRFSVACSTN